MQVAFFTIMFNYKVRIYDCKMFTRLEVDLPGWFDLFCFIFRIKSEIHLFLPAGKKVSIKQSGNVAFGFAFFTRNVAECISGRFTKVDSESS